MNKKILEIKWQRLVYKGETCSRCEDTERELNKAVSFLTRFFTPIGIEIILKKEEISLSEFEKDPLKSNEILINNIPIENYLSGKIGQSPCCSVCGPSQCRTLEINGKVYETITADIIIKAAFLAVSQLFERIKGIKDI
ncbi:MAG: DUF2703 domain-containing protein [candidate division WOR-3 bacterium]|nr:DUF2703 domain-containing protein [candidate division WOR-3 bacterium]MCX7836964.1 DUF2703 domain-containing protein [candidate division WOR-3 bacterium]MDW8114092.1 DUF2703 domain-containing protein [candidate division WOR-3 bacterium]